jgi:hypothetical protein
MRYFAQAGAGINYGNNQTSPDLNMIRAITAVITALQKEDI